MKVQVLKENLKDALSVVERAKAKTPTLPALGAVCLTASKNTLELAATDLEIGIRYRILAKTEKEGTCVVPLHLFSQLVAVLPEREIALAAAKGELAIESKEHQTALKTLPTEDFPIIPSLQGTESAVAIGAQDFCAGLARVVGVAAQNQARPEISGVFLSLGKEGITLAATDSFRLAEQRIPLGETRQAEASFILPQRTARELAAVFGGLSGQLNMYVSASQVLFDYAGDQEARPLSLQIVSRLIEGEYPRYQDVIPGDFALQAQVPRLELVSRVRAASVFSGKMQDVKVKAEPKKKGLEISSQSADLGSHSSFLAGDVSGKPLEVSFNWKFLAEGLLHMKAEEVKIGFAGQDAPAVMRPADKERYLYVVMPVKA